MAENNQYDTCNITLLPNEILPNIFFSLPPKQLLRCRQVCMRWMDVIDGMIRNQNMWRGHCENEFPVIYETARVKAMPNMTWYDIYKSLSLWPKLIYARENSGELVAASSVYHEVRGFELLRDGVIGVHSRNGIVYYDTETLERIDRNSITGDYLVYNENDHTIAVLSYHLHLFLILKKVNDPSVEPDVTFDNTKMFILTNNEVYFVTLKDDIYVCNFKAGNLQPNYINTCEDSVVSIGVSNGRLHILSFQRNIYTVIDNNLILIDHLGPDSNLLHILRKYNLFDRLDWRVYFQWMYLLNHSIPEGSLQDIIFIRIYGEVAFVGTSWGVLSIYYAPYVNGQFDIFNTRPIRQFNFMEYSICPVFPTFPVLQVDVSETENGHKVIVAMPKKIAVLNFSHNNEHPMLFEESDSDSDDSI